MPKYGGFHDDMLSHLASIRDGGGGGGGGDSSEAKQDLMIQKLDAVNDKLPVDLEVDG